jgi:NAD(P)-dependent dehydrogenase (short-subunit alcohol dehydrogenase family)
VSGQVDGKVALLTGAASGIGAATAKLLLAEGATVIATDIDRVRGEALVESLQGNAPGRVVFRHHDVTDEARWQALVGEAIDRHGRLDILINNAGVLAALTPLEQTTL